MLIDVVSPAAQHEEGDDVGDQADARDDQHQAALHLGRAGLDQPADALDAHEQRDDDEDERR